MIIVKLMGGLGNQLFQYAAGRRLAHRHNTELKLDTSFLSNKQKRCTPRRLELEHLNIKLVIATPFELATLSGRGNLFVSGFQRLMCVCGVGQFRSSVCCETVYHYDPRYEEISDNSYLEGYWQSERYFSGIEDVIRDEFTVTSPLNNSNRLLLERIQSCNSVSVHVRRGDYITNLNVAQYHGTCGIDYYRRSVEIMDRLVDRPQFFVFSDDPEWANQNLGFIPGTVFVTNNGTDCACDDLRLMSTCSHHIIANSSFSWWGAWLGNYAGKKIIAPAQWNLRDDIDTTYLCPPTWIRI